LRATPRTDPGTRNYRTGLLPRVVTCLLHVSVRAHVAGLPGLESRTWFARPDCPWPNPFPPGAPPSRVSSALCSRPSTVLWVVRLPAAVHRGCTFIFDHADHAHAAWPTAGPPGFRAGCFGTCQGSSTTRSPHTPRDTGPCDVAFRTGERRRHSGRYNFRGSISCPHLPLSTLPTSPCGDADMTRGPVWLAAPSLQETFTLTILPAYPGASPLLFVPSFPEELPFPFSHRSAP
jgi:hypothetical protein